MQDLKFEIEEKLENGLGRAGTIKTAHGEIKTPAFMVVGMQGFVKNLTNEDLRLVKAQAMLSNGYHLRNKSSEIAESGGLAEWSGWKGPTLTDSGGFQVMSLGSGLGKVVSMERKDGLTNTVHKERLARVEEAGVYFTDPFNGRPDFIGPEESMQIQCRIGADIHMAFDELTSPTARPEYVKLAMNRTHAWAKRCLARHQQLNREHQANNRPLQALFGVVQGGQDLALRRQSAETLGAMAFDGYGIGGVFKAEEIAPFVGLVNQILPENRPRHLLGMGSQPIDIFTGVEYGVDTFDCVAPTRQARNGSLYTTRGRINIKNAKYKTDFSPLDPELDYAVSQQYTKAYLHHLFKANEILAAIIASAHNEFFVVSLTDRIRQALLDDTYEQLKADFFAKYAN